MRTVDIIQTDDDRRKPEALDISLHHELGRRFAGCVWVRRLQQTELGEIRRVLLDLAIDLLSYSVSVFSASSYWSLTSSVEI